jgi:putative endonuclease
MPAWLYILRLKSGTLYVGSTTNLNQRYLDHCSGKACRTTRLDPPLALVHTEEYQTNIYARKREAQIKRWTKAKKEALIAGDLANLKLLSKSKKRIPEKNILARQQQCPKYPNLILGAREGQRLEKSPARLEICLGVGGM